MLVRKERLELSRVTPLEPKSSASTSSATLASSALQARGAGRADYSGLLTLRRSCAELAILANGGGRAVAPPAAKE